MPSKMNEMKSKLEEYENLDNSEKWNMVRKSLWNKYHCCVYTWKGIIFSAWNDVLSREMMQIVIELVNEIAEREPSENIIKYEFDGDDGAFKILKHSAQFLLDTISNTDYEKFNIAIYGKKI